tara:strand:+ start:446 stop:1513 length:1068 start_codon:yes stop_codon:yes gene_type:complete
MFTQNTLDIIYDHIYPRIKGNILKSPELNKLYEFFCEVDLLSYDEIDSSFSEEKFRSDYELEFASENIKNEIEKYNLKYSYTLQFDDIIVTINLFTDNRLTNGNFIYELKRYIQFILSVHPVKTDITINYHLSDQEKKVIKGVIPTRDQVNSGSCMKQRNGGKSIIHIWRKEEILKVTLHEIIHALRLDNYTDDDTIIRHYENKYDINVSKINTHEAYTEIWANLVNCFLISQKYNTSPKKVFSKLVTVEKYFSIFQAQKVLFNTSTIKNVTLDKNTNVTAYFLIRAELYQRLNEFLKFCRLKNEDYIKIKNTSKWLVFLNSKIKVKRNDIIFKNQKGYLYKNLRMTILELNLLH